MAQSQNNAQLDVDAATFPLLTTEEKRHEGNSGEMMTNRRNHRRLLESGRIENFTGIRNQNQNFNGILANKPPKSSDFTGKTRPNRRITGIPANIPPKTSQTTGRPATDIPPNRHRRIVNNFADDVGQKN